MTVKLQPEYEKILRAVTKSVCGNVCDHCYHIPNSCDSYKTLSKLSIDLVRNGIRDIKDKPDSTYEVAILKQALTNACGDLLAYKQKYLKIENAKRSEIYDKYIWMAKTYYKHVIADFGNLARVDTVPSTGEPQTKDERPTIHGSKNRKT